MSEKQKMIKLSISMPEDLAEWLRERSDENMRSVSAQLSLLVKQWKESEESGKREPSKA
jgi:hypothetical protein